MRDFRIEYAAIQEVPIDGDTKVFTRRWARWFQQIFLAVRALTRIDSTLAGLPIGLGGNDVGSLFLIRDYNHFLQWNGMGWQWGPGELGSGYKTVFLVPPDPAAGWHLCDGTTGVTYLKGDGTLGTIDLPTEADTYFRQ